MPKVDFSKVIDSKSEVDGIITPGTYLCQLMETKVAYTQTGDMYWNMNFVVKEPGEFHGWHLWDNLVFSQKAYPRAKLILKAFGVLEEKEKDYQPEEIEQKYVRITIDGDKIFNGKKQPTIAFDGYESIEKPAEEKKLDIEIPF